MQSGFVLQLQRPLFDANYSGVLLIKNVINCSSLPPFCADLVSASSLTWAAPPWAAPPWAAPPWAAPPGRLASLEYMARISSGTGGTCILVGTWILGQVEGGELLQGRPGPRQGHLGGIRECPQLCLGSYERGHPFMMSTKILDFLTPSPLVRAGKLVYTIKIHATSLTLSAFPLPPPPSAWTS